MASEYVETTLRDYGSVLARRKWNRTRQLLAKMGAHYDYVLSDFAKGMDASVPSSSDRTRVSGGPTMTR